MQQVLDASDQILRLKRFAYQFVGLHRGGAFRNGAIHHAGHQNYRRLAEPVVLLDELANLVAVFVRHDYVGDHHIRSGLVELLERGSGIRAGDHVDVFLAKSDLDHFAHSGAVVDEIYRWSTSCFRVVCFAHDISFSISSRSPSSNSRMASSKRSVAERNTVLCVAVAPYTNL